MDESAAIQAKSAAHIATKYLSADKLLPPWATDAAIEEALTKAVELDKKTKMYIDLFGEPPP
jgi:hypothetical protein